MQALVNFARDWLYKDPDYRKWSLRGTITSTLFCKGIIIWQLGWGEDVHRVNNAVNQAFVLLGTIIGLYMGAVTSEKIFKSRPKPPRLSVKDLKGGNNG